MSNFEKRIESLEEQLDVQPPEPPPAFTVTDADCMITSLLAGGQPTKATVAAIAYCLEYFEALGGVDPQTPPPWGEVIARVLVGGAFESTEKDLETLRGALQAHQAGESLSDEQRAAVAKFSAKYEQQKRI